MRLEYLLSKSNALYDLLSDGGVGDLPDGADEVQVLLRCQVIEEEVELLAETNLISHPSNIVLERLSSNGN